MKYWLVEWLHNHQDEPIIIYSEIDENRNELRKVELYADGTVGYADAGVEVGGTGLSLEPLPQLEEIATDPQFKTREISKDEFQTVWFENVLKMKERF